MTTPGVVKTTTQIDSVKLKLKSLRSILTKSINCLREKLLSHNLIVEDINLMVDNIKEKSTRLESLNVEFELIMIGSSSNEELEREYDKIEEYRERVTMVLSQANQVITKFNEIKNFKTDSINLPRINLPTFSGNVLEWFDFDECFQSTVGSKNISNVEKFSYLKSQLHGEAANTVSGLSLTNANYSIAYNLLVERYGSKQRRIRAHIRELLNMEYCGTRDASSLRHFVDKVNLNTRGLDMLGVATGDCEIILSEILLNRIPQEIKQEYSKLGDEEMSLKELLRIIENHAKYIDISKCNISNDKSFRKVSCNTTIPVSVPFIKVCNLCNSRDHQTFKCYMLANKEPKERIDIIKKYKLCFNCFGKHNANSCDRKSRCKECNKLHNTMLHIKQTQCHLNNTNDNKNDHISQLIVIDNSNNNNYDNNDKIQDNQVQSTSQSLNYNVNGSNIHQISTRSQQTILPIIPMPLTSIQGETIVLNALLDTGAERSFIRQSCINNLFIQSTTSEYLSISNFGEQQITQKFNIIMVLVEQFPNLNLEFIVSPKLCNLKYTKQNIVNKYLRDYNLQCKYVSNTEQVDIIIGADTYYKIVTGNTIKLSNNTCAIETIFGWTLHGNYNSSNNYVCNLILTDNQLQQHNLQMYWDCELSGILQQQENNIDNNIVHQNFENSITYNNNRYTVKFPWIENKVFHSTFYKEANARLQQTTRKLTKLNMVQEYHDIINDYLEENIIEPVNDLTDTNCRYLPHHPVVREDKVTGKIRIVFDASSKQEFDNSLNDNILEGPNMFTNIAGILMRFRMFSIGIISDVQRAFLQISLCDADRNFVRFLWYDVPPISNNSNNSITEYRFTRIPFGTKSSPYLLNATLNYHFNQLNETYPNTIAILKSSMYVDDFITSVKSIEEKSKIIEDVKEIFKKMSMTMHKWHSNNYEETINNNDTSTTTLSPLISSTSTKVLGIHWDFKEDKLFIKAAIPKKIETKRQLASFLSGFFDPLGFFSPFIVRLKIIFRDVWQQKDTFNWDTKLSENYQVKINEILLDLKSISNHGVNRSLNICTNDRLELHGFGDASVTCYSSVIYLNQIKENGTIISNFIISKNRLSPTKILTLPKLELMASLITSRLLLHVKNELSQLGAAGNNNFNDIKCTAWSDSKVCLAWISNDKKKYDTFIQNRVTEIRKNINSSCWSYIPSEQNPADLATKSFKLSKWLEDPLWWNGPDKIREKYENVVEVYHIADIEINNNTIGNNNEDTHSKIPIIDVTRFSKYNILLRTVCYVHRFIRLCQRKSVSEFIFETTELNEAEIFLIKQCQRHELVDYHLIINNIDLKKSSKMFSLQPFVDTNGLVRVRGRLSASSATFDEKHPIILSQCYFTKLLINHYHNKYIHAGPNLLMMELRRKFWIICCRRVVKSVIHECLICRRQKIKPNGEIYAPLPKDRVDYSEFRPFESTGIDFFGPILIAGDVKKYYVLLLTCLKIRAIHMEVTTSLETKSCYQAIIRFISRRGIPNLIRSDNAKTFKATANLVGNNLNINWLFNVDRAPWTGGVWERLIRSVKGPLRLSLKNNEIKNENELYTTICEIENLINHRPITYVTGNESDILPLTPWNFINQTYQINSPLENNEISKFIAINSLQSRNNILKQFWKQWKFHYLSELQLNKKMKEGIELKVGDVVLLNEGTKKHLWPMARILELRRGRDSKIRSVKLNLRGKELLRPIGLLYNLEIV